MEDITKTESGLFEVHTDRSEHELSGDFSYITFNDVDSGETLAIITAYNGHNSVINFPAYIDGYKVIQIAATDNIGLNIPDDMLNSIFEVDIPGSIENIGASAFSNCKNLKRVNLHNGLKRIGFGCFWGCESLEQLDIPDTVEAMENAALCETGIKEIKLPREMRTVSHSLVQNCSSLKKIIFPENVESIGLTFYDSNTALEEIVLSSEKIQYIDPHNDLSKTLWYKKQPSGWVYLDDCLIGYKHDNPDEMDEYDEDGNYLGQKCMGFNIKKGTKKIFGVSQYNIGEEVIIPDGVTYIGKSAINNECIKKLTIPESVKAVDFEAIDGENLVEIELMGDINYIVTFYNVANGFAGYRMTKEPIEEDSEGLFHWCPNLRCIKVHTEKMKNYCEQHNYPYEFIEDTKPARKSAKKSSSSENSAPAGKMKFCPFCGGKLVANAPFCAFCGEKIPVI